MKSSATSLLPTAALLAITATLAWVELGRIAARDWLPYAVITALVLATVLWSGIAVRARRGPLVGAAALLGLAGWAALSLTWSAVPSLARDEALLTLFYAIALLVPLVSLRTPFERTAAIALLVLALGVVVVMTALKARFGGAPADMYDGGRLDYPVTYVNGTAAFFLIGFWPAIVLVAERAVPRPVRALFFGVAVALLGAGAMAQSKGSALGLAVSALAFFALCPGRLRALVPTALATAIVGAAFLPLTAPFRATNVDAAIRHSASVLFLITLVGLAVGAVYAGLDSRVHVSDAQRRRIGIAVLGTLAAAAVAGVAAFFATIHDPGRFVADKWKTFKHQPVNATGTTHLTDLGSNRYDFWRVAAIEFGRHPFAGVGARGFMPSYLKERRSPETPARAHSLPLEVLAEDGLVGFVLLVVALGIPLLAAARAAARGGPRAPPAAAAFAGAVYWLGHATVDWIWTIPAVALVFFVLLGIGASGDGAPGPALGRRAAYAGAALAVAAAAIAFGPPWVSARLDSRAEANKVADGDLRWARRLDPLSLQPLYAQFRLERSPRARIRIARQAVAKEPRWVGTQYLLGVAYLQAGMKREARKALKEALRLDPRERRVKDAYRRAGGRT